MKSHNRLALLFLAIMLLPTSAAIGTSYPLKIKDCRGKSVTIPSEPKRIVSLAPSNTEILYALGLEAKIVGVSKYCNYPAAARKKTPVGDRVTSVERVISLKPDLVLAHGNVNRQAIRGLENHGLKVMAIDPLTIDDVISDILLVGKITNREKNASQIAGRITSARAKVQQESPGKTKPKVLFAVQADPLWAAGPKTLADEMIRLAGGENIAHDARPGFNQFSAEAAVWRNPEVIIGTARGDRSVFTKGLWKDTKAARTRKVFEADPDLIVRAGPRLADGILAIAEMINATNSR